jgi:hypothetical protein
MMMANTGAKLAVLARKPAAVITGTGVATDLAISHFKVDCRYAGTAPRMGIGGDGRPATTVGRFMVDRRGACRARFNLPSGRSWTRFLVTPPGRSAAVLATT